MPKATLERGVEQARNLTEQEQQQLRGLLDSWLTEPPERGEPADDLEVKERLLTQRLLEKGIISKAPTGERSQQRFKPIRVLGRPVSETLLEDRC